MVRFPILTFAVRSKQVVCQVVEILRQVDVEFQKGILVIQIFKKKRPNTMYNGYYRELTVRLRGAVRSKQVVF